MTPEREGRSDSARQRGFTFGEPTPATSPELPGKHTFVLSADAFVDRDSPAADRLLELQRAVGDADTALASQAQQRAELLAQIDALRQGSPLRGPPGVDSFEAAAASAKRVLDIMDRLNAKMRMASVRAVENG